MASIVADPANEKARHPVRAATLLYTAPRFILRGPIYLVFVVIFGLLIYSFFATIDTVVSAPLTLQRQSISVQAINGGLVESIPIKENMTVAAGDALAVIQEKIRAAATPEQEAILHEIRELSERRDTQIADYRHRRSQLISQRDELIKRKTTGVNGLQARVRQVELQLQAARTNRAGLADALKAAQADADVKRRLASNRDIPAAEAQRAEQRVRELERAITNADGQILSVEHSVEIAKGELLQASDEHALERLEADIAEATADLAKYEKTMSDRISDLERRQKNAQTLVPGVRYEDDKALYSTTVPGIVSAVHIQRGQIINPGANIATIIRETAPLEARVLVQNKDIGLLKHGQAVQIKYFAYPYQQYGIQAGFITGISPRPSAAPREESLYVVNVALDREAINEIGKTSSVSQKQLEIGLLGTVEIMTGKKRFIEILFAPASRFFNQAEE